MPRILGFWIQKQYVFAVNFVSTYLIMAEIRKNVKNIVIKIDFISRSGCVQSKL